MPTTFSVIVPTYNRPEFLRAALASIRDQTVADFECLVIDDASFTAAEAIPADDRFRLITLDTNVGPAACRNVGVRAAVGDVVTFLDDDDLWTTDRLALAAQVLAQPGIDVAVCGSRYLHEEVGDRPRHLEGDVHDTILDRFTPNLGRTAVRRSAVLPFDEDLDASGDVEWWLRQSAVSRVGTVPEPGLLSRHHDGVRHGNGPSARITAGIEILRRHRGYFATHPRARAFREYRVGMLHRGLGDHAAARRWFLRSLRSRPSAGAAWATVRSLLPDRPRP